MVVARLKIARDRSPMLRLGTKCPSNGDKKLRVRKLKSAAALLMAVIGTSCCFGLARLASADEVAPRIGWYGTLESGLAAAKRTGRPILLVSGAPHCHGVSGIW